MRHDPAVTFVIMAGGRGERLWPLVRTNRPKVCLSPDGRRALLQSTIERLRPVWPNASWLIVITADQLEPIRRILPRAMRASIVVEPQGKNTAACLTLAAVITAARDPGRVLVAVPADHWIAQEAPYQRSVRSAIRASAAHDAIATIGIQPTGPTPGLGYLWTGAAVQGPWESRVLRLHRFVEKPTVQRARRLLRRPRTYWNSGIFVGTADRLLEAVTQWLPEHSRRLAPLARHVGRPSFAVQIRRAYAGLPPISFDHGVMDHVRSGALVVEGQFSWADLGSWDAWAGAGRAGGLSVTIDCDNVQVVSEQPHLVAAIGMKDVVVVHTPSATLVCQTAQAQRVRDVVQQLAQHPRLAAYR